jgi:hypothetical protein
MRPQEKKSCETYRVADDIFSGRALALARSMSGMTR